MRAYGIPVLIAAVIALSGAATAQVPRGFTPQSTDQQRLENNTALSAKRYQDGMDAMKAKNFVAAESIFEEVLRENGNHAEANLMMGTVKMSLGKWEEAKKFLEIAAKKSPKAPDPKSRLGVTLIKLGDINGAMAQRAELEKLDKACKGTCKEAQWITGGIAMIDSSLPPKS